MDIRENYDRGLYQVYEEPDSAADEKKLEAVRKALEIGLAVSPEDSYVEQPRSTPEVHSSPNISRTSWKASVSSVAVITKKLVAKTLSFSKNGSGKSSPRTSVRNLKGAFLAPLPGELEAASVAALLKQDENFVGSCETLANSCKNFSYIDLTVPNGQSVVEFCEEWLAVLREFKEEDPKIKGNTVPEVDLKALRNFIRQIFLNDEWKNLFCEMIQRKDDAKNHRAFLSSRVRAALAIANTAYEFEQIASHLMSECMYNDAQVRIIKHDALQLLLLDNRIASFNGMRDAIKKAAQEVMVHAIRKCQSDILFKALGGGSINAGAADSWEEKAKTYENLYLDLEGIQAIAKECKLKVKVNYDNTDQNQQKLSRLLSLLEKITAICDIYHERASKFY